MIKLMKYEHPFFNLLDSVFETDSVNEWSGHVNVFRTDNEDGISLEFSVPGLTKDDLNIFIDGDKLKVSYSSEEVKTNFVKSFERTYSIGDDLDSKKITAKVDNGILTVLIPKDKKKNTQRTISIN
jgi:HSP20 family protein